MKIVTHSGHFHADELLAVAALLIKFPNAEVVRSRNPEVISQADIVVDVGHVHDPARRRFDHHQPQGAGVHDNGIPYASFGLVWKEFGEEIAGGRDEARYVEESLVMPVDALDNGVRLSTPLFENITEYSIGDFFESFAYGRDSLEESEKEFFVALPLAQAFLGRKIGMARTKVDGWRKVRQLYEDSKDKRIIVLPAFMSWKHVLIPSEALFVVYPRIDGTWAARAIPQKAHHFEVKKPFPSPWGGKDNGELAAISGVEDALFCLRDLWLAAAKSQEGALKLAEITLNS